jgi:mttA/Hcf106 family protein
MELLIVGVIAVLLFGKRLPEVARQTRLPNQICCREEGIQELGFRFRSEVLKLVRATALPM